MWEFKGIKLVSKDFAYKGPDSKCVFLFVHSIMKEAIDRQYLNAWVWLCPQASDQAVVCPLLE